MAHSPRPSSPDFPCLASSSSTPLAVAPPVHSEPITLKNPLLMVQAPHLFSAHYRAFGDKPKSRKHPALFPRQEPRASKPVQGCSTHTTYHCHSKYISGIGVEVRSLYISLLRDGLAAPPSSCKTSVAIYNLVLRVAYSANDYRKSSVPLRLCWFQLQA